MQQSKANTLVAELCTQPWQRACSKAPFFPPFQRKWAFFLNSTKFLQRVNPPPWAQALFLPACTVQAGAQRTFCSFAVLFQLKRRPRIIPFSAG